MISLNILSLSPYLTFSCISLPENRKLLLYCIKIIFISNIANRNNFQLRFKHVIGDLFNNCSFSANETSVDHCKDSLLNDWTSNGEISIFVTLCVFICTFVSSLSFSIHWFLRQYLFCEIRMKFPFHFRRLPL